jgi:hypothetical protein
MDVADTLRHIQDSASQDLVNHGEGQHQSLDSFLAALRELYRQQGITVPEHVLQQGVAALANSQYAYHPPKDLFQTRLARLYVARRYWGRPVLAAVLTLALGFGGYFLGYKPYLAMQTEAARLDLAQGLPARLDALYQSIYNDTKVQKAALDAQALVREGKQLAQAGDRNGALKVLNRLTALQTRLRQQYTLRIVNRPNLDSGFWMPPKISTAPTNHYLVVEAVDGNGKVLSLPVTDDETGKPKPFLCGDCVCHLMCSSRWETTSLTTALLKTTL